MLSMEDKTDVKRIFIYILYICEQASLLSCNPNHWHGMHFVYLCVCMYNCTCVHMCRRECSSVKCYIYAVVALGRGMGGFSH